MNLTFRDFQFHPEDLTISQLARDRESGRCIFNLGPELSRQVIGLINAYRRGQGQRQMTSRQSLGSKSMFKVKKPERSTKSYFFWSADELNVSVIEMLI